MNKTKEGLCLQDGCDNASIIGSLYCGPTECEDKPMSFDEFMSTMLGAFPDAVVDQDNFGQLIIYTNLKEDDNGNIVEMTDEDFS